jgi:hypothetical protein
MGEGGTRAGNTYPPSALAGVALGPGFVAAHDALEHEFTVASAVSRRAATPTRRRKGTGGESVENAVQPGVLGVTRSVLHLSCSTKKLLFFNGQFLLQKS